MKPQIGWFSLEQRQDVRALAMFRILVGKYLIYDILSRLQHGCFSLLWYTSTEGSFLHPDDTPHRSPIHRIWFYRGSELFQVTLFAITFLLAISFTLGYKCNVASKTLLWLNVVAMQCRCMPPHDGSDTFIRHLLLWSIQLPMSQVWSMDAARRLPPQHYSKASNTNANTCLIQNRVAVWGLRSQIVFMYLGTVMHRTIDPYGLAIYKSKWLPPQLTAVHYALSGSLATKKCWLGDFVRATLPLSQFMTFVAMVTETFAPVLCLILGNKAYIPAFFLFNTHFGLLILMNMPNWQIGGMIASVIWLPSWVWDGFEKWMSLKLPRFFAPPRAPSSPSSMKKKDMVPEKYDEQNIKRKKRHQRPWLSYFFLFYISLDFVGNRGWIRKIDHGDIGEFLRFSQFWVMYSGPPTVASQVMVTGTIGDIENINVWEWVKSGATDEIIDMETFQEEIWTNMTHVYPSPRVERSFSQWTNSNSKSLHFLNSLCKSSPFNNLRMIKQSLNIMPPGSETQFTRSAPDIFVDVEC